MCGGGGRVGLWGAVPCVLMGNRLVEKLVGFEGFGDGCKLNRVGYFQTSTDNNHLTAADHRR